MVLAGSDVTRSHTFRVANTSGRPVKVLGFVNRKPCCGEVKPIAPTTLEIGQAVEVAVTLHIGLAAGQIDHFAEIETEEKGDPVLLRTSAKAHARVLIEEVGTDAGPIGPGQSRRVEYLIRSYSFKEVTPPPLADRAIRCGLPTAWVDSPSSRVDPEVNLVEDRRTLAVTLPAATEPGHRSELLEILDASGAVVGRRQIAWEITSALMASPAGLVFATDTQIRDGLKVVVRCRDGRPFRIASATTEVNGLVVEVDADARPVHILTARFKGRGQAKTRTGAIVVRTDHPDQPICQVAVYVAGAAPRETPGTSP